MSHSHSHRGATTRPPSRAGREAFRQEARLRARVMLLLAAVLVPVVAALVVGAVALWPSSDTGKVSVSGITGDAPGTRYVTARTTSVTPFDCVSTGSTADTKVRCAHVRVVLTSGRQKGASITVDVDPTVERSGIAPGDEIKLARYPTEAGTPAAYAFVDFVRSDPLVWLALAFAVLVIAVARFRGLAALVGLALSFAVLIKFTLPALLSGENPLAVALVSCGAIMCVLLYLAHGVSIRTTTALIGTLFGLGASAALGTWAVAAAHLTGVSGDDDLILTAVAGQVRLSGLLLAGIVVASLGILNDVTVTQASAVWELRALDPTASPRRLFAGAMRIGRDHIASTVYTIVFAYAGAALPVLMLINLMNRPVTQILTGEALGEEIVRTLVGSIGLVLSVPLTTAVGVALVRFARGSERGTTARSPNVNEVPGHR
ncbi:MAG: hypothetical protein QOF58_4031 [Pseudonocardiales bacterium]|nr:hypothetical protein [Pseudonocardiales bacterium]